MNKLLFLVVFVVFGFFVSAFMATNANAQTCSGSYTSTGLYKCEFDELRATYRCPLTGSERSSCSYSSYFGDCRATVWVPENCDFNANSCATHNKIDGLTNSGCSTSWPTQPTTQPTSGSNPTPQPGWGGCGSCSSCPVASECVTAPDGTCHWDPGTCSTGGGDPSPTQAPATRTCGERCDNDAQCQRNNSASVCQNGTCVNRNCPTQTRPGANCECDTQNACGQPCGINVGLCQPGSQCGFVGIAADQCVENESRAGRPQSPYQFCLPNSPNNGYNLQRCSDMAANRLIRSDGTWQGMTQADILTACAPPPPPPAITSFTCPAGMNKVTIEDTRQEIWHADPIREYNINIPNYSSGLWLIESTVGHPERCNVGPGNDNGVFPCDQTNQIREEFNFLVDNTQVALLPDHGTDKTEYYTYPLTHTPGAHEVEFRHTGDFSSANSVGVRAALCVNSTGTLPAQTCTEQDAGFTPIAYNAPNTTTIYTSTVYPSSPTDKTTVGVEFDATDGGQSLRLRATITYEDGTSTTFLPSAPCNDEGGGWYDICGNRTWRFIAPTASDPDPNEIRSIRFEIQMEENEDGPDIGRINVLRWINLGPCYVPAWWRATGGDIITNGSITTQLQSGTNLINSNTSTEGIAVWNGTLNLGTGQISTPGWGASSGGISGPMSYTQLKDQMPADLVNVLASSSINSSSLTSGGTEVDGYVWYESTRNIILGGNAQLPAGRKVVVFVDGDVDINGHITLADQESSFLMIIASGDITFNTNVGTNTPTDESPHFMGILYTEGSFITDPGRRRLNILGSVVALRGVNLQRDIDDGSNNPSETITYSPELMLNYPESLRIKRAFWKEVAP